MEINQNETWVADRLALVEPVWQPDRVHAREQLSIALSEEHSRFSPWAIPAVAAVVCAAILAIPQTRAIAQGLWAHVALSHVDVIRLDLSRLPLESHVKMDGSWQEVPDLAEAERRAGFRPNLPAGVLATQPRVTVISPLIAEQTIHVHDLEAALAKVGATDLHVAPEWDGVILRSVIGPLVGADYPGGIEIVQSPPISLTMPAGFPLERFAETAFRSIGVSSRDATTMAKKFAANPAWLLDIPADEPVNVQELSLTSGPALLVEDFNDHGAVARDTVIRSTRTRIYSVASPNRDLSVKIANALP